MCSRTIVLCKSLLMSTSRSCKFYSFLLVGILPYQTCHRYNINISDYICDTPYFNSCKSDIKGNSHDALSDAVSFILHANCDASKSIFTDSFISILTNYYYGILKLYN